MCAEHGALFIVNDYSDVARIVDADGLHVGQGDLPVAAASSDPGLSPDHRHFQRALAGGARFRGRNCRTTSPWDRFSPTSTKENTRPAGLETLAEIKRSVGTPVVAIGGINHDNASRVADAGADAICVATAVTTADDPERATRTLSSAFAGE